MGSVSRSLDVAAPPQHVWDLVTDLPRMGEWSPENRGGRWVRGSGPTPGSAFVGRNGRGVRRWSTRCTVVRAEEPLAFAFDVSYLGLPVARWTYEITPTAQGCRVTESWQDQRGWFLRYGAGVFTGVFDRDRYTAQSIEQTLARVKQAAEAA